jgi:hypothetical protein
MLRRSASFVVVPVLALAVFASGCSKKDDATGTSTTGAAAPGAPGAPAEKGAAAGGKAVAWEKVERVPFAKLQATVPDPILPGFKRTEQGGQMVPDGESTYSEANATFQGPGEAAIHIKVQDHPIAARDSLSSKTASFKGYPVVSEGETTNDANFKIIVADRFLVEAHGDHVKAAQVKAAVEKIDLAKIASWKLEGIPK